ncbi:MAG: hypothetical protein HYU28_08410 [Actinobacteria bacterium]|nr:hypothetical protein [Actinomycetota bacterium]
MTRRPSRPIPPVWISAFLLLGACTTSDVEIAQRSTGDLRWGTAVMLVAGIVFVLFLRGNNALERHGRSAPLRILVRIVMVPVSIAGLLGMLVRQAGFFGATDLLSWSDDPDARAIAWRGLGVAGVLIALGVPLILMAAGADPRLPPQPQPRSRPTTSPARRNRPLRATDRKR